MIDITETCLMKYLHEKNEIYHSKIIGLRDKISSWLVYIPQTFGHFTDHTVKHSDEIIVQLSKLLFKESDYEQPTVFLSPSEVYVLAASAYLHDAGMVSSEKEKIEILSSEGWKDFTSEHGSGYARWKVIEKIRNNPGSENTAVSFHIADLQTRFLLAEFIRKSHHMRVTEFLQINEKILNEFGIDKDLKKIIIDVCVAHGFSHHELNDKEKYPFRTDIGQDVVNVRFMAHLLRIGDLLDMRYDRACPLILNAASPLPQDSYARWTKYQRITNRLTAPDIISLTAYCENQDEHKFLQDWCSWLVDEISEATVVMSKATRHNNWSAPLCSIDGPEKTISIKPSQNAKYFFSKWKFDLDRDLVFQRLISDLYDEKNAYA